MMVRGMGYLDDLCAQVRVRNMLEHSGEEANKFDIPREVTSRFEGTY